MDKSLEILIIDDDPEILKAVGASLKHHGHRPLTSTAEDNGCILELRRGHYRPDLILMDILLSGTDGRRLCQEFKTNPQTATIPIIMFSAYPNIEPSAKAAGADAFLPKPFGWRDLNYLITELLDTKKIG